MKVYETAEIAEIRREYYMNINETTKLDKAELLNYLKIINLQVGLIINFNTIKLVDGLKRIVNNYKE